MTSDDAKINISCEPQDVSEATAAGQLYVYVKQLLIGFSPRVCLSAMTWALVTCYMDTYREQDPERLLKEVSKMYAIAAKSQPVPRKCTTKLRRSK